ncbi:MAG TPA: histidine phosphatase family protein [Solirubrobacteraceae bacterium]|nr:histidine phosphatase family protein [Solirubrobacteraceae bacterium]
MRRLLLVRHASTSATRAGAFPLDEPLDEHGQAEAARLPAVLFEGCEVVCSPALRCRQTAAAVGLTIRLEPEVAECDFGSWGGATLAAVDPAQARAWMTDPDAAPHGGETLRGFAARIARWLDAGGESATVITHGGVVRAAVVHALGAPLDAFWKIAVGPLSVTELACDDGAWTLRRLGV